MAKVCKRKKVGHKRRQQISKRGWLLHRHAKGSRKVHQDAKTAIKSGRRSPNEKLVNLLTESTGFGQGTHWKAVYQKVERFSRCFILSLSYTASSPVSLFCACMSVCCNGLNKGLVAVNKGKEKVHTTISSSMLNGYFQLKKMVSHVGDTIFPSRPFKRKLDEMSGRLEEVEKELKRLKTDFMLNQQTMFKPSPVPDSSTTVISAPLLPPPPPPPPPPLPPICNPPPVVSFKKTKKINEGIGCKKKQPAKVGISLEELVSVKLRKVVREDDRGKENVSSPLTFRLKRCTSGKFVSPRRNSENTGAHSFISLKDIKKVSLRKTQTNLAKKNKSPGQSKLALLKTNLRKVSTRRSPGGTPLVDKSKESHGEGLTPIMTRALQRKFKFANPPSPIDSFNETNSFIEKTLTRASPRSPMTRLKAIR